MERILRITEDGTPTLFVQEMDEPYHSLHGAIRESRHVFIRQGLLTMQESALRILEVGFGTGLNALLTLNESISLNKDIYYHAVEKYPLNRPEYRPLNYEKFIDQAPEGAFDRMHECPWGKEVQISERFVLYKETADFRSMNVPPPIHLVYFDAFSPEKQPELWTEQVMDSISRLCDPGAVLVTYSAKGAVRRTLASCGFDVFKVPGPPGKREMIRAVKR
jgi:tRNA U34 5-methylaminomethyl-2-thiouridine-forming methyltransferase MnmC